MLNEERKMKIDISKQKIRFIPEDKVDCYNLGIISRNFKESELSVIKASDSLPEIQFLEISMNALVGVLINK